MDVGTTLRTAREERGLSIEQVSRSTKIGTAQLRALERNAFDALPGGIVLRGFLRSYAREVGLEPEALVRQFIEETHESSVPDPNPAALQQRPEVEEPRHGPGGWGFAFAVLLVLALVFYTRSSEPDPDLTSDVPSPVPATADPSVEIADEVSLTSGGVGPDDAAPAGELQTIAAAGRLLRIEIAPHGPCWVEVVADGRQLVYRLMQAGERESFEAGRDVTIRTGDPATFAFTIDGRPGRSFGRAGVPATLRLTVDDYEGFISFDADELLAHP